MKNFLRRNKRLIAFVVALSFVFTTVIPENYSMVFASEISEDATSGDAIEMASSEDATINSEADVEGEAEVEEVEEEDDGIRTLYADLRESGCSITVNATSESLPYPKDELSLSVRELEEDSIEYYAYLSDAAKELGEESTDDISFARFFDIEILYNGEKVEPESPVEVKIDYDEAPEIPDGAEINIVHFGDEGTEVINDVQLSKDASEISYDQGSFSVTGTVVSDPEETEKGRYFALVVKYNNKVYTVQDDGSLAEVKSFTESSGDVTTIVADNPMMWTYVQENGSTYIRYNSEGFQFNWMKLAEVFEYTNIAPNSDNGLRVSTPKHENDQARTVIRDDDGNPIYEPVLSESKIVFENNNIRSDSTPSKYLTISADGKKIQGNADSPNSDVKFYFVRSDSINDYENDGDEKATEMMQNHLVNHIDIEIEKTIEEDIPLAYGNYYDKDGNLVKTVTSPETIHLSVPVAVSQEQLRKAEIHAYKRDNVTEDKGDELNDAFYITGYSANDITDNSTTQIRIEGLFKVAYCNPITESYNTNEVMADRLSHRVIYTLSVVEKDFEFKYYIPDPNDSTKKIYLYNDEGQPLSVKTDVTVSAQFDYFDITNKCPPLQGDTAWQNGAIPRTGLSGMDFVLVGSADINLDPVAINIHKEIKGIDGSTTKAIIPKDDQKYTFNLYSNTDTSKEADIIDFNRNAYSSDYSMTNNGYSKLNHTRTVTVSKDSTDGKGLSYDYNIPAGMIGISEDKSSVPDTIVDKDGVTWEYKETVIKTEYVRRKSSDQSSDVHVSKTYNKNDAEFFSIPEILGDYTYDGGTTNKSEFVEFYVENVYEKLVEKDPKKEELSPDQGTGELCGVKVGDEIEYKISYENYSNKTADIKIEDVLDSNVKYLESTPSGTHTGASDSTGGGGKVSWTLSNVTSGTKGFVTLKVKVLDGALKSNGGNGKVVNGGDTATVQVGSYPAKTLDTITNPVQPPSKKETSPYDGTGSLGGVNVDDNITYEIEYTNYKSSKSKVTIIDKLDDNVTYVSSSPDGNYDSSNHIVKWELNDVDANKTDKVTLTVKVKDSALKSENGPGFVVNGDGPNSQGKSYATVQVGSDSPYYLDEVKNPVPKVAEKTERSPYIGSGELGRVDVGAYITYRITYENYYATASTIKIEDVLDPGVEFVSATDQGAYENGIVKWTLNVQGDTSGYVELTVKVLDDARKSSGGAGKVVNGGSSTTVKVGNDPAQTTGTVTNPVPEPPIKREISPYYGTGSLGAVNVGDNITYEIEYTNYKSSNATVNILDVLDKNVTYVSSSPDGNYDPVRHAVIWSLDNVESNKTDKVTITVKVKESALISENGPGYVSNGDGPGSTAFISVDSDMPLFLNYITNPVPKSGKKTEISPYQGNGELGAVEVGDEITYRIDYENYQASVCDIKICDKLDDNVEYVKASSDSGDTVTYDSSTHTVDWTLKDKDPGYKGYVTLTVKVLKGACKTNDGPGEVINGGSTATIQVGNDAAFILDEVKNPVNDPKTPDKPEDPKDPEKTGGDDSSSSTPKDPEKKDTKVTPPDASGSANSTPSKSTAKTGDTAPFIPVIIVMILSGVCIAVLFVIKRRKNRLE